MDALQSVTDEVNLVAQPVGKWASIVESISE